MKLQDLFEETPTERAAKVKHDQFYTRPEVAAEFAQWVKSHVGKVDRVIDPCAGSGEILKHFPGAIAMDIDPHAEGIRQGNFLHTDFEPIPGKTLVVGSPPFGYMGSLAIPFINHAAEFADYIAFILPRSMRKPALQNRVTSEFSLADDYTLPKNSFYLPHEGVKKTPYDVHAVAQLWVKKPRTIEEPVRRSEYIAFVRQEDARHADIAFRRKGYRAGQVTTVENGLQRPSIFYFIKILKDRQKIINTLWKMDWSDVMHEVVGSYSISMPEIIKKLETTLKEQKFGRLASKFSVTPLR